MNKLKIGSIIRKFVLCCGVATMVASTPVALAGPGGGGCGQMQPCWSCSCDAQCFCVCVQIC